MQVSGCSIEMQDGYISGYNSIMKGVFKYVGTYGLPLEVVIDKLKHYNITIDWMDYITDALNEGHNPRTIQARILEAAGDVFGVKYRNAVKVRLDVLFRKYERLETSCLSLNTNLNTSMARSIRPIN